MNTPININTTSTPLGHALIAIGRLPSSPMGPMWIAVSQLGLVSVEWDMFPADYLHQIELRFKAIVNFDEISTAEPIRQLSEYLDGNRQQFDLPLDLSRSSPFQAQVLRLTMNIPYGQTSTYKDIALQIGKPNSARAVGRAEATNPIPLVIPCHRVLGTDGTLHGYGGPGGIKLKRWLLNLEKQHLK
jgi:methylated-DNA-[protein]-cysteine S-methyltransferase